MCLSIDRVHKGPDVAAQRQQSAVGYFCDHLQSGQEVFTRVQASIDTQNPQAVAIDQKTHHREQSQLKRSNS